MTPLEINQKIAELKGFKISLTLPSGHPDSQAACYRLPEAPGITFIHNWAENIKDAEPLLEELPSNILIFKNSASQKWCCHFKDGDKTINVDDFDLKSAAISTFYIAYRTWMNNEPKNKE